MLRLGNLFGIGLLRDMFVTPSPRLGGYEHVLRRQNPGFCPGSTNSPNHFPERSGAGKQEMARRLKQMARNAS